MRILFGSQPQPTGDTAPIFWDTDRLMNPHFAICGPSGSGKTTRLRRLMTGMSLADSAIRFIVLDPHGDMAIDGESEVKFSSTSTVGLNPLRVRADIEYGGVDRAIELFITTIGNAGSHALGSKQRHALANLMADLYLTCGFDPADAETWSLKIDKRVSIPNEKRHPTLHTLSWFIKKRATELLTGTGPEVTRLVLEICSMLKAAQRAEQNGKSSGEISKLKGKAIDAFAEFINNLEYGTEVERLLNYGTKDTVVSLHERVANLYRSGLFREDPPDFDNNAQVWRYNLSALTSEGQVMAVNFISDELFYDKRQSGLTGIKTYLVIDEAHKFLRDESDHVLSVIAREARKFGLGLVLSSQNIGDFPDQILSQMGTKWVLGVDPTYLSKTARKLRVPENRLSSIMVHRTSLISFRTSGMSEAPWIDLNLPEAP